MTGPLEKIKSRGYWHVILHPSDFQPSRLAKIGELEAHVRASAVQFRGWDFPHIGREGPTIGIDFITDRTDWSHYVETWRFYQSGQFVFLGGIWVDWRDQSAFERPHGQWKPGLVLPVTDTVFKFTEIFEFAARLAAGPLDADRIHLDITVVGLEGRELWIDNPHRSGFTAPRRSAINAFPQSFVLRREELVARTRELALRASDELFARFGWSPGEEFLSVMQGELFRR